MTLQCLSGETHGRHQIAMFAEEELDRIADDRAIEVHPSTASVDVSLIDIPLPSDRAFPLIEPLQQQWRETNDPTVDRGMIDVNAAFCHHLFQITQAQIVGQVPADAQQDHRTVEMAA